MNHVSSEKYTGFDIIKQQMEKKTPPKQLPHHI